ncbi:MAG: hypothetical protein IPM42_02085 [Saprospiraceae bacterium]|nr:hypothetical protein [Saprospiraceae bacterium]
MADKTIWEQEISPFKQLVFVLIVAFLLMSLSSIVPKPTFEGRINNTPWIITAGMLLFYALTNSVMSFGSTRRDTYWLYSILCFGILMITGSLMAWAFSGLKIDEAGTFRWIFFVFTFGYLIFLSIVNLIRFLVELAQKNDKHLRGED